MDDRELTEMIREGFSQGAGTRSPARRWNEIATALQPPKRKAPRWGAAAAAALLALLLSSLLHPVIMAAASSAIRNLFQVVWEGDVGGTPAVFFTLPEQPALPESAAPPGLDGDALEALTTSTTTEATFYTMAEAAEAVGFFPPEINHERTTLESARVTIAASSLAEARSVSLTYRWGEDTYFLTTDALFMRDEHDELQLIPATDMSTYLLRDEQMTKPPYTISLGHVEALCIVRDFGHGRMNANTHCQWIMDGMRIHLTGSYESRVVELARSVAQP